MLKNISGNLLTTIVGAVLGLAALWGFLNPETIAKVSESIPYVIAILASLGLIVAKDPHK